ncbi:type IV toxin-antitoxin system AbiEi family antitoxin domain-containing protein [Microbacterium cremeum]|uniref:type IV toxin-antitoxin system AbiEi family antitoxin domain-containing protein n=1 Tax=Microbacterium cremeum TaxID=2782169 RepID=UPI001886B029|nr:type IV toxin-antitoxin system AbiEi family antitoxin domain-containing protein [Microbacterium cremeum]
MSVDAAVEAVRRAGGIARTAQLAKAGVAKADLTHAVREARLLRPRHGVYVLPDASEATIEALSHRGAVACVTAGRDHGLWVLDDTDAETTHTWVRAGYRTTRVAIHPEPDQGSCCVFHRDHPLGEPELGRVGVLQCLVQILHCRGEEAFFAALESALRQGLVDAPGRIRLRRHVPARCRWLVDFARTDADSGLESLLRLRLHKHGIHLASQVPIPGVGRVDFVIGDCLIIEADGDTHDGPARHRDRVRDAAAMALGFVTLRLDYAMIVHDWPLVESAVLAAVGRNLHRSVAGLTW